MIQKPSCPNPRTEHASKSQSLDPTTTKGMQAGMHDDELKGTNRAERCRERSSDTEEPGRGCQERARQKSPAIPNPNAPNPNARLRSLRWRRGRLRGQHFRKGPMALLLD